MRAFTILFLIAAACGDDGPPASPDAGVVTTDKCDYVPLNPTAHAGGTVTAAQLQAGAAETIFDIPVGTALGGYTARAGFLGAAGVVDTRKIQISSTFNPSIGVEAAPRVKALALTAGDETVVILKSDLIYIYEGMVYDLEQRLGPDFAGKVILTSSHSHSAWAQHYYGGPLQLGGGIFRELVYNRFLDAFESTARTALANRRDAKIGFFYDGNFDPTNQINHDRRGENDMLPGGNVKDNHFYMIRVDGVDDVPIAALPVFGEHGTLNSEDNPLASTDAPGALERVMQEQFTSPVVVMHLQSAGGDNSPSGHGGIDCNVHPGKMGDPCLSWATEEGHGRAGAPILMDAWTAAGANMQSSVEMEMVSRSIEVGPKPETFTIRNGALAYAPFDLSKTPDGVIYDNAGALVSPIDEFNAPVGAALCQDVAAMFPAAEIAGDEGILPYGSCLRLDAAGEILGPIFKTDFGVDETSPVCEETRTTISALRINDYVFGTMPGELTVMLATYMRTKSPVPADHTVLLGYSQGHMGYMLRPEDWMMGGYEPSITFWGPLAAERVGEQLIDLMGLVMTPEREDGTTGGTTRVAVPTVTDGLDIDDPAPEAGTVPATVPPETWARTGTPASAQPDAQIQRVSGIATFVFYGDDPQVKTPQVTLQYETSPGVYSDVTRKSGRVVEDQEITKAYTPSPLQRMGPQHHVWVVEWQAVPWLGSPDGDTLDTRANVRLGNYRFHVVGSAWTLDSNPFAVVAGGLQLTAARATTINVGVRWYAPKGWRLMDMNLMSNQPIPVRSQSVTVALLDAANAVKSTQIVSTDASGNVSVPDVSGATQVKVTDASGNTLTVAIP
jgi:neutral ceramidase